MSHKQQLLQKIAELQEEVEAMEDGQEGEPKDTDHVVPTEDHIGCLVEQYFPFQKIWIGPYLLQSIEHDEFDNTTLWNIDDEQISSPDHIRLYQGSVPMWMQPHDGKEKPDLDDEQMVIVQFRNEEIILNKVKHLSWMHNADEDDVMYYAPIDIRY